MRYAGPKTCVTRSGEPRGIGYWSHGTFARRRTNKPNDNAIPTWAARRGVTGNWAVVATGIRQDEPERSGGDRLELAGLEVLGDVLLDLDRRRPRAAAGAAGSRRGGGT